MSDQEREIERLRKKTDSLQALLRLAAKDWPHCPGCGHDDDEGHKSDCVLRSEYTNKEPTWP